MRRGFWAVIPVVVAGCATPYGPRGGTGGYQEQAIGKDRYQVAVGGNEYTDQGTLMQHLHRRAFELCGNRGYSTSNTTATSSPRPVDVGVGVGVDAMFSEADAQTVTAIIQCNPPRTLAEVQPGVAKPPCPELDPEVERLRPAGYVSPEEANCTPAPKAREVEWVNPADAATRKPVAPAKP
jgi:hypothetical protein